MGMPAPVPSSNPLLLPPFSPSCSTKPDPLRFVREHLHRNIAFALDGAAEKLTKDPDRPKGPIFTKDLVKDCIGKGYNETDKMVREHGAEENWTDGCCTVLLVVVDNAVYVANLGDSRVGAILWALSK